jgi:hypothetical protein
VEAMNFILRKNMMKKLFVIILLLSVNMLCTEQKTITIELDQTNSKADLLITLLNSKDHKQHIDSLAVSKETKKITIKYSDLTKEHPYTETILKQSNTVFMIIQTDPNIYDYTTIFFKKDVAWNDSLKVLTAPFGEDQTIGAVAISSNKTTRYEPKGPQNNPAYFYNLVKNVSPKKS